MVFQKIGLNTTPLTEINPPSVNISNSTSTILNQIPAKANEITNNYLGLGIMTTLFFFLVYKLGKGEDFINEQFSTARSVGISAGVVSLIGINFLALGYFKEYYHVVIYIGILLLATIVVWYEKKWLKVL